MKGWGAMRVAICDDEKVMHIIIENLLIEYKNIRNIDIFIDKFENGYDLLKSEREYEIIFMDYQMDGLDGIETARKLRDKNNECCVIFISAFMHASVPSHEVDAFRFILKPINKNKLFDAIDAYLKTIDYDNLLILRTHEATWKIKMSDIIYAEAKEKHTIIRTKDNTYEIHIHLKKIEDKLPIEKFFRCQRRYIAGFAHIEHHTNTEITFDNGELAQIGKSYVAKFKKAFQEYIMRYNERML